MDLIVHLIMFTKRKGRYIMTKKFKKTLVGLVASAMCVTGSMGAISASAATYTTYHGSTYKNTNGGNGGYVRIRTRAFTEYYSPAGGVNVYSYGVESDVITGSSLQTYFSISGSVSNSSSSASIGNSGTAHSIRASKNTSSSDSYNHVNSSITTNSSSFGYSYQECNFDL